ncbi:MAG: hypothetical protein M9920_14670 [Verrucomicrobiae bacterium]|nr:hypothetical protein [Verrucomicrobiae bacterium]
MRGKLIWKSLKTDRISVAKLRLSDFHKEERQRAAVNKSVARGKMTFGNAVTVYQKQRNNDPNIKPGTVEYDDYRMPPPTGKIGGWWNCTPNFPIARPNCVWGVFPAIGSAMLPTPSHR